MLGIAVLCLAAIAVVAFGMPPDAAEQSNEFVIVSQSPPDYLDPAKSYQAVAWQLFVNSYNGLLTYRKRGDSKGAELVPDLAAAMPQISDDGQTYRFRIRRGVRFSPPLSREVRPSDFKWTIERLLTMASPGSGFYAVIDGYDEFTAGSASEVSGIVADDSAYTLTFHLNRADPTFQNVLAMAFSFVVPTETPAKDMTSAGFVPATGPYMFSEYRPGRRIVMTRNPNFRSWSPDVPAGYVDRIRVEIGVNPENGVTLIKRGEADYIFDPIPKSKLVEILDDEELLDQLHVHPAAMLKYVWFNTQEPPFDNVLVRQAVNWAIDRRAMVKLSNGTGEPTENVLPPIMPGYKQHNLYPGPDLATARRLIAESGIQPGKLAFWCSLTEPDPTIAQYMQGVLNSLGFDTEVRCIDRSVYYTTIGNTSTKALIGFGNWGQDFPDASNFIDVLLNGARIAPEHNNNYAMYTGADDLIARANATLAPASRIRQWADIDRKIIEDAAWAPYMTPSDYKFVSERVSNFVPSPVYGMLFSLATVDGREVPRVPGASAGGGPDAATQESAEAPS